MNAITLYLPLATEADFARIDAFLDIAYDHDMELRVEVSSSSPEFLQYCEVRGVKVFYR